MNGEGNWNVLFQEIVDHMYNSTEVKEQDTFITTCTQKNFSKRQQRSLKSLSNGRMVAQHENDPQGYEELIPCTDGIICGTAPYFRRSSICMVYPACAGKAQPHHWNSEVKLLGSNAQV